jgi:hypothetical protein
MILYQVGAQLFYADGQRADREYDEANIAFSQFYERA